MNFIHFSINVHKKMEEKTNKKTYLLPSYYNIQVLFNKIRLGFFSLVTFNKIFHNYHRKYEINVIRQLYDMHNVAFLLDKEITVYIFNNFEGLKEN